MVFSIIASLPLTAISVEISADKEISPKISQRISPVIPSGISQTIFPWNYRFLPAVSHDFYPGIKDVSWGVAPDVLPGNRPGIPPELSSEFTLRIFVEESIQKIFKNFFLDSSEV